MILSTKIFTMEKMVCYNALKARRGERCSDGKKRVRGRREPPDAEGDQLRGVRGVPRIKSKIGAGGSHFGLPAPIAACFTQIKDYSDFEVLTCIALGYFYRTGDMLPETASAKSRVASFLWVRLLRISLPSMRWKVSPTREKILGVFTQKLWWQRIKGCRSRVDRSSSGVCRQRTVSWSLTTFV